MAASSHFVKFAKMKLSSIMDPADSTRALFTGSKCLATLGPESRSVAILEQMLMAGMTVARFDFSWGTIEYHTETMRNLQMAIRNTKRICAVCLDTTGPELMVIKNTQEPIKIKSGDTVVLTTDVTKVAGPHWLPVNYLKLPECVGPGDSVFVAQYLFTGSDTSSAYLEVDEVEGCNVICRSTNDCVLEGQLLTVNLSNVHVDIPTLTDKDKADMIKFAEIAPIDFVSLSFTRHRNDVKECRAFLQSKGMRHTMILAKIETKVGLLNFEDILAEADGVILSRGNLGIDLPPEKMFNMQKKAIARCNEMGKPVLITRVLDSMTDTPRPTRAEATDVANAVLDGVDGIMLGAETLRGKYPVEAIKMVLACCHEAEKVFDHAGHYKKLMADRRSMQLDKTESIASSAVRVAEKAEASLIIIFTQSGKSARLIAKYRPPMPILCVVIPLLSTDQLKWHFTGDMQARQTLVVRGLFPLLADPNSSSFAMVEPSRNAASVPAPQEGGLRGPPPQTPVDRSGDILSDSIKHAKAAGLVKAGDRIVVSQRLGESAIVKIVRVE